MTPVMRCSERYALVLGAFAWDGSSATVPVLAERKGRFWIDVPDERARRRRCSRNRKGRRAYDGSNRLYLAVRQCRKPIREAACWSRAAPVAK
jgi:hypothetical protein